MAVPLLNVKAQNLPLHAELRHAFGRVLESGVFIGGPEVENFEKECAEFLGVDYAIGCSSGTDAILLALMALGIGPGDEVLVPTFTFFATAGCVARTGATPVFVDACPVCFNLDAVKAAAKVTAKTKAIIPVHLFGQCADMDAVMALASAHNLKVIEDGAQSFGAKYKGKGSGTMGNFGTYSFFPSKNLGGFGDAGMLVTNDDALADMAGILRNHGSKPKYYHRHVGANFRLDPLQAAMLRVKLTQYSTYTANRQRNAADYIDQLSKLPGVVVADPGHCKCAAAQSESLQASGARIVLPVAYAHNEHIWNQFTLRVLNGQRDELKQHLATHEIGCEIYYPVTMDQQECFAYSSEFARKDCPVAHQLAQEVISIPIYPELSEDMRKRVVEVVANFLAHSA